MKNSTVITSSAITLIIGLTVGYALWGNKGMEGGMMSSGNGMHKMPDGTMMGQNIDEHFITQMIPHHQGAIDMAKVALERSKRSEVVALASAIIKDQQKEINDMTTWYKSWFGKSPTTGGMGMMHMGGMEGDVARLKTVSSSDFDKEFLIQMIPHHEMAIMMVQMLQVSTERQEMKQLADQINTSQSREITMMRGWLKSWYGQ